MNSICTAFERTDKCKNCSPDNPDKTCPYLIVIDENYDNKTIEEK